MNLTVRKHVHKIIALALVVVTLLGALGIENITAYAYTAQNGMIYSSDKSMVETKKSPSPNAAKANGLLYGKPVTVVDEVRGDDGGVWYKLNYKLKAGGTATGYCPAGNVLLDKNITVTAYGALNANNINLRDDAGTDRTTILTALNVGHKVEILDDTTADGGKWYRVRAVKDGVTYIGWIFASYISETLPDIEVDEAYEDYLRRVGFPESYVHSLAVLHALHPNWVFEPVKTGLTWAEVIEAQSKPGRALIQTHRNDALKSYASSEYNWYTNQWVIRDSSSWVTAHPDYIAYCMDPRNWFNETNIFMFESLSYSQSHNIEGVNAIISGTFMTREIANGDGTMLNYANAFMEIAKAVNVSPYHLAGRVKQEQGVNGTSGLISGTYPGYEGYYNYFNHGAYGTGTLVYTNGLTFAKNKGWNTRYKSLYGGSEMIAKNYIAVGQDTLYFQKFDVIAQGGLYNHQYMTNIEAAISESKSVAKAYTDKNQAFTFKIPVYESMPSEPVKFTASGNRNNYLKTLNVSGVSLTPSFDGAKTSYTAIVGNGISSVNVTAEAVVSAATVSGTGTHSLAVGTNTINVYCKSQSGDTRTYTVTVVREPGPTNGTTTCKLTSNKYSIGTYITGIAPGTKVADLLAGIKCEGGTVKVLNSSGVENNGVVGTGNKLAIYENGIWVATKEIVIYGDVSGDGKINALDAIIVNKHTIGFASIGGSFLVAADVSGDGKSNALDAIMINKSTIGLFDIKQR